MPVNPLPVFGTTTKPKPDLKKLMKTAEALAQNGDIGGATRQYAEILAISPNHVDALFGLGVIAFDVQRYELCIDLLGKALDAKLSKQIPKALYCLATSLQFCDRQADAIPYFRKILRIDRNHQAAHRGLALACFYLNMLPDAIEHFKKAVALKPTDAQSYSDLGAALFAHGQVAEAEPAYRRALELQPDLDRTRYNLGSALQALGRFDDAVTVYKDMIAVKPEDALAYLRYAQSKKVVEQDIPLLAPLEQLAQNQDGAPDNRINAFFALGKIHDDLRHYDQAFAYYQQANELDRPNHHFDRQQLEDEVSAQIDFFSAAFFHEHRTDALTAEKTPIFIVGMPRSGTTLIDQILSNHSTVASAGEQNFWIRQTSLPMTESGNTITPDTIQQTGKNYLDFLRAITGTSAHIIDKLPHNFLRLGYIHLCFPDARIIHSRRDPLDTCLSMFFQKFIASHPYANNLDDLAFAYQQYQRLMAHWAAVMPEQILQVDYEAMVASQEEQTRRLLDFCGLAWEDGCLNFAGNERAVLTASNWQVRQPINNKAVARWKHYQQHVGPLACLITPDGK